MTHAKTEAALLKLIVVKLERIERQIAAVPPTKPKFLTRKTLAAYLGVEPWQVDAWRAAGLIPPPVKLDGDPKWLTAAIDKVMDRLPARDA